MRWPVAGLIRGDPERPEAKNQQAKLLKGLPQSLSHLTKQRKCLIKSVANRVDIGDRYLLCSINCKGWKQLE